MLILSSFALLVLIAPTNAPTARGVLDSTVPDLPGGYESGRVSLRVMSIPMPEAASAPLVGDLVARTGVAITETQGVRIEVVLPDDVQFTSMRAHVVDGLVLHPEERSLLGSVGHALVNILRMLLVGQLISAADDLAVSGALWAAALGAPNPGDELVRLSTSEMLQVDRDADTYSDHGDFVVCRAMIAFSPWTELVGIRLRGFDRVSGKDVEFFIPRLSLSRDAAPATKPTADSQWAVSLMAVGSYASSPDTRP